MFLFGKSEQLKQQEKLRGNATVLWMNAAVSPIFAAENKNWMIFGGYRYGNKEKTAADYHTLQMQYSAVNHDELLDKMQEILEIGESESYQLMMKRYQDAGFFELRREQLCSEETFPQMKLYQRRWLYDMIRGYKVYGEKAILAFDLCRVLAVAQMGFMVGHLSLEEALDCSWKAAIALQASFTGWEEMCDSFLRGYAFHTQQDKDEPTSSLAARIRLVEELQKSGCPISRTKPFDLHWDTLLEKCI